MPSIDIVVRSELKRTSRVNQLEGAFDVPAQQKLEHEWHGNVPLDERYWNVGLIVGSSGSGKSCIVNQSTLRDHASILLGRRQRG